MTTPGFTTEVRAVNRILQSIGERPVNNLADQSRLDVIQAVEVLNEVNVLTQSRGWWFNTEREITLAPDGDGVYQLPTDVIKTDLNRKSIGVGQEIFTQRGHKLFDQKTRLFTGHTADIIVDWVRLIPFDDMPENARLYVSRRAGVTYQGRNVGSPTLFEFTEKEAREAWGLLLQAELDDEDLTLENSPLLHAAVFRR